MRPNGEIVHVGAKDPRTDRPKSKDLVAILQSVFLQMARDRQCKAVAIVYDVVVTLPQSNLKSDAIQVCVDHSGEYSAEVFFPYQIGNHKLTFGEAFAQQGKNLFFKVG